MIPGTACMTGPAVRWLVILSLLLVTACSTGPRRDRPTASEPLKRAAVEILEDQLLDVWIELFDPGELPEDSDDAQGRPDDTPDGSDDDVVARQLREAAEKEQDPELKKRLWEEYRRYKRGNR